MTQNARLKTVKLLEENRGDKFRDIGLGNNLLYMTSEVQTTKAKIDKTIPNLKNMYVKGHNKQSKKAT